MNSKILYLFTRTPLHVGAGASVGAIDQPIQRERHTGFPIIPGSSLKGVLADLYLSDRPKSLRNAEGTELFGRQDHEVDEKTGLKHQSGSLSIAEGRLLAFPVRSAKGCFAWVTSPLLLERWKRDTGKTATLPAQKPTGTDIYGPPDLQLGTPIVLEDYALDHKGIFEPGDDLLKAISDSLWTELSPTHLCLISDDMLAHYARTACEVAQHVSIDDATGAAADQKLFNQENVPADTLFYSVLTELRPKALEKFHDPKLLQVGGDATTGLGFCTTQLV
ncbi:MAG: type III-B CRISPR module RAMP protein Cmr4 [Prosthecobacter sp.]|uniref:type III-B CRISPR module RAMP protein Cmr4 n=1 Tax=Prosthecobacter sp. TaxID=1965333 RepID=UPI003902EC23